MGSVATGLADTIMVAVCGVVVVCELIRGLMTGVGVGLTTGVVLGGMMLVHIGGATLISWTVCGAGGVTAGLMIGVGEAVLGCIVGP